MIFSEFLKNEHKKILGWCDEDKAQKFYDIITESKAKLCVEIGVFGGSSLIPQALAMKDNNDGIVVGIDPWTHDAALEDMEKDENKEWWSKINLDEIYKNFTSQLKFYKVDSFCKIYRDKSENVINEFKDESIDILHIDGNHCEKLAYQDSVSYFPKVKKGGYIFFDDTSWSENGKNISTEKGLNYLLQYCEKECIVGKDCVILKKNN
ncbi:MAG: class I SAM-dependent methyltransferase [Chryseobacterium sp.]